MIHVNFSAGDYFGVKYLSSINEFIDEYPRFQTMYLDNQEQLKMLFRLLGFNEIKLIKLHDSPFSHYCDISFGNYPEFVQDEFDDFYKSWISHSKRENTMNEYGSLIFLTGLTTDWNKMKYRLITIEL